MGLDAEAPQLWSQRVFKAHLCPTMVWPTSELSDVCPRRRSNSLAIDNRTHARTDMLVKPRNP